MMQYKHRWYYVFGVFFLAMHVAYFFDIRPGLRELALMHETENQLIQELTTLKKIASQRHAESSRVGEKFDLNITSSQQLMDLFLLAHKSEITMQSVNLRGQRPLEFANFDMIHLIAAGSFIQVATFLFSLSLQPNFAIATDFLYRAEQYNKFIFSADIMLWRGDKQPSHGGNIFPLYNPFCFSANEMTMQNDIDSLKEVSLDEIKIIGFLQQANRKMAIISLPNGVITDIGVGNVIGKERGMVKGIMNNRILVEVNGKKRVLKR